MDLKSKATIVKDRARSKMNEARLDSARDVNDRLKTENSILKEELDRTRSERERALETLERFATPPKAKAKKHRVRRFLTLTTAAGAAYVVGAKAGRERYEQIRTWLDERMGRNGKTDWQEGAQDMAYRASDQVEEMGERASNRIQDIGDTAANKVDEASRKASKSVGKTTKKASGAIDDTVSD